MNRPIVSSPRSGSLWHPNVPFAPARFPFFYGWVIVAAATVGIVFSIPGQTMGFSVFTDTLMAELRLTRVELSFAYCLGTMGSGFTLPWLGRWFDRLGARRMAVLAAVATGLVLFYLSYAKVLVDFFGGLGLPFSKGTLAFAVMTLGFYLIRASAQGVLTMTSRNAIGKWFDFHRGTALAVSGVVTAFTFSVAPRFLDVLISRYGWDGAWRLLGALTLTLMVGVGWLFYRDNPEECGLSMDGPVKPERARKRHADSIIKRDYMRGEALRTWAFWAFNGSFAFYAMYSTAFTFHIVSLGAEMGRTRGEMIGYFLPMSIISVMANLFCGWVSPWTRLKYLLFLMNLAGVLAVVGAIYLRHSWGVFLFIGGNGVCAGAFVTLSGLAYPRFFGRRWLGAISGIGMSSMVLASGVGPYFFSLSWHWSDSYVPALWACGAIPAGLAVGSWWADNPQRQLSLELP